MNHQNDDPWTNINQKAEELTRDTYDRWKDELDNLLIFAALFSAIVTAFTIEVANTIEGDSGEMTVLLLKTLVQQVHNLSNPQPLSDFPLNLEFDEPSVPSLVQQIYVLYCVSLTLSLIAVLGGIVCLQWLREFNRNITGLSHKADLSLQNQRHRSMRKWGVLALLNTLPLLLLVSLALFFVGFFIALWDANALAAGPVTVLVALAGLFIVVTSFLPSLQIIWLAKYRAPAITMNDLADSLLPPVLCPYRSPQAWLVHSMLRILFSTIRLFTNNNLWLDRSTPFRELASWTDYDTWWTDKYETPKSIYPALTWIATEFKQSKDVVKDAYRCFLSAITDTSCDLLPEVRAGKWVLVQAIRVPENAWTAFGFPTLSEFKINFPIDSSLSVWNACLEAFSQIWDRMEMFHLDVDSTSDLYQLLHVPNEGDAQGLLMAINKALVANPGNNNISITDQCAVAATCHLIDQHPGSLSKETIPILINLCKRYTPNNPDYPDLIGQLCDKIREKHAVAENHRNCTAVLHIFNAVFPSLDSSIHKDNLRKMLGRLLGHCPRCTLENFTVNEFFEIIQYLAAQGLIGEEESLDETFLYTAYLMERADWPTLMLPSIEKTFNAILAAAEDYCVRSTTSNATSASTSTSTTLSPMKLNTCVFHPSRFSIGCPMRVTRNESAWELIDDFNKRLKALFEKYEEGGGVNGHEMNEDGKGSVKFEEVGSGHSDHGISGSGNDMDMEMNITSDPFDDKIKGPSSEGNGEGQSDIAKDLKEEGTSLSRNDEIRGLPNNKGQVVVGTSSSESLRYSERSPAFEPGDNSRRSTIIAPIMSDTGVSGGKEGMTLEVTELIDERTNDAKESQGEPGKPG